MKIKSSKKMNENLKMIWEIYSKKSKPSNQNHFFY